MKKILLISNYVHHYRIKNYNYFFKLFNKKGYDFSVASNAFDKVDFEVSFTQHYLPKNLIAAIKLLKRLKPDYVIVFLHLKDIINFPVSIYCKLKRIPHIFWNKGVNVKTPNSMLKNRFYYFLHNIADRIILYTPNEIKDIKSKNYKKISIGYNTLSFDGIDKNKVNGLDYVKQKYGIKHDHIVLFAATINPDKKLDELLKNPCPIKDIGVVIAGKGIQDYQLKFINSLDNYYYIGLIPFDDYEMNSLFKACRYFTTPGDLGLSVNQAFYWGKPVVALDGPHSVEAYYLRPNKNSFLAKSMTEFWTFIDNLQKDKNLYQAFSNHAYETYTNECHIRHMFNGFYEAIKNCNKNHILKSKGHKLRIEKDNPK